MRRPLPQPARALTPTSESATEPPNLVSPLHCQRAVGGVRRDELLPVPVSRWPRPPTQTEDHGAQRRLAGRQRSLNCVRSHLRPSSLDRTVANCGTADAAVQFGRGASGCPASSRVSGTLWRGPPWGARSIAHYQPTRSIVHYEPARAGSQPPVASSVTPRAASGKRIRLPLTSDSGYVRLGREAAKTSQGEG